MLSCFCVRKSGTGKGTISSMRSLLGSGIKVQSFSDLAKESHVENFSRLTTQRKFSAMKRKSAMICSSNGREAFHRFSDCLKHSGAMLSSSCLNTA